MYTSVGSWPAPGAHLVPWVSKDGTTYSVPSEMVSSCSPGESSGHLTAALRAHGVRAVPPIPSCDELDASATRAQAELDGNVELLYEFGERSVREGRPLRLPEAFALLYAHVTRVF